MGFLRYILDRLRIRSGTAIAHARKVIPQEDCPSEPATRPQIDSTRSAPSETKFAAIDQFSSTPESENLKGRGKLEDQKEVDLRQKPQAVTKDQPVESRNARGRNLKREAYYVQVGLDFGTSYCKVVCREIFQNRAWVHTAKIPGDPLKPFLLPSALQMRGRKLCLASTNAHYHDGGLPHVKIALAKVAEGDFSHDAVASYARVVGVEKPQKVKEFVSLCAIYLLGGILAGVKDDIGERYPDFGEHEDDYIAVSLAVPVADAGKREITRLFRQVLCAAFECVEFLSGFPPMAPANLAKLIRSSRAEEERDEFKFYVYPEVSAGVQGFVRSRVSRDGIYLFSETGAATVDQSVFILFRPQGKDAQLTYLSASVLMLGSSQIEHRAASLDGGLDYNNLERWRRLKEEGDNSRALKRARTEIGQQLQDKSWHTLGVARRKLPSKKQFDDIRLLFGGGGHLWDPYGNYVLNVFDDVTLHGKVMMPQTLNLPVPKDLDLGENPSKWMNRLWIAYGLSFYPGDFPNHQFPDETPDAVPVRPRDLPDIVRHEDC